MLDSIAPDGTVVGILGEMTLLRYFQQAEDMRPDVKTIAADPGDERLAAIAEGVAAAHPTYTTRPVDGLAEQFSLSAEGPLIRVWPAGGIPGQYPIPANETAILMTNEVSLVGWEPELRQPRSGPSARLNLLWQVRDTPPARFQDFSPDSVTRRLPSWPKPTISPYTTAILPPVGDLEKLFWIVTTCRSMLFPPNLSHS